MISKELLNTFWVLSQRSDGGHEPAITEASLLDSVFEYSIFTEQADFLPIDSNWSVPSEFPVFPRLSLLLADVRGPDN